MNEDKTDYTTNYLILGDKFDEAQYYKKYPLSPCQHLHKQTRVVSKQLKLEFMIKMG